jgi:Protein of unknown function (DUF3105)
MAKAKSSSRSRRIAAQSGPSTKPRFNWTLAVIAGGIAAIAAVVVFVLVQARSDTGGDREAAIAAEADASASLPGDFVDLQAIYGGEYSETAGHVSQQVEYTSHCSATNPELCNTDPPVGGPHWSRRCESSPSESQAFCGPAPWGVYREQWEPETLVHNMEHGGLVLWYNTQDQRIIDELEAFIRDRGGSLVMAPYSNMEDDTIALTGWSRLEKFSTSEYTLERVEQFIDAHLKRFNPEGF